MRLWNIARSFPEHFPGPFVAINEFPFLLVGFACWQLYPAKVLSFGNLLVEVVCPFSIHPSRLRCQVWNMLNTELGTLTPKMVVRQLLKQFTSYGVLCTKCQKNISSLYWQIVGLTNWTQNAFLNHLEGNFHCSEHIKSVLLSAIAHQSMSSCK